MVGESETLQQLDEVRSDGVGPETSEAERAARLREVEPIVRRVCRRQLGPSSDADEAVQRALVRVWQTLQSGRELDTLRGYAITTARYEVLNTVRDASRQPVTAGDLAESLWVDPTPGPVEQLERRDEVAHARERVEALLSALTPRQVELMRASVLAERSPAEVAAEFGTTAQSVRHSNARAMEKMRELSGTHSTHPLALPGTRNERRRAVEAARAETRAAVRGEPGRGPGGARLPDQVHQAGRAAAAQGRTAVELADQFGVSEATAKRWRRSMTSDDPLVQAREAVDALTDGAPATEADQLDDPLDRARRAMAELNAGSAVEDGEPPRTPHHLYETHDATTHDSDGDADGEVVGAA